MATVTIGSSTYDVYSDVATADIYFNASTRFEEWDAFTDDEKARGLVQSTRLIDRQVWEGEKTATSPEEPGQFPRTGLTDCYGDAVDSTTVPAQVIEASQLLAIDIMGGNTVETSRTQEDTTKRLKADTVEIENFRLDSSVTSGRFPLPVMDLISCFLSSSTQIAGSLSYGTDGEAADNDFTLNEGF